MSNYSYNVYIADGNTDIFAVSFPYLSKDDIDITVNDIPTNDFTWLTESTIKFSNTPPNGAKVEIKRNTEKTSRLVDFQDTGLITEQDLDKDSDQLFFLIQEALDTSNKGFEVAKEYTDQKVTDIVSQSTPLDAMARLAAINTSGVDKGDLKSRLDDDYLTISTKIGDITTLPDWLQDSIADAVKQHDAFLRERGISIRQPPYNCKGDGSDETAVIQTAINDAKNLNRPLIIPDGIFGISSLILPSYFTLYGNGRAHSKFKALTSDPMIKSIGTTTLGCYGLVIKGIGLDGNNISLVGIDFNYTRESLIEDCAIHYCVKGVKFNQSWSNSIIKSEIKNNIDINIELGSQSNNISIFNCQLDNAGNNGIRVTDDSQGISIVSCVLQNCGKEAILLDAGRAININGCYFENNNTSNTLNTSTINAKGTPEKAITGLSIVGCEFWDYYTISPINLDYIQGVFIAGSSLDIITGGNTTYSIITSTNTFYVSIIGCYKVKGYNDLGNCIVSLGNNDASTLHTNLELKKPHATLQMDTPDDTTQTYFNICKAGIKYLCVYGEVNGDTYIQVRNSNGTLSNVIRLPQGGANGGVPILYNGADFNLNPLMNVIIQNVSSLPPADTNQRGRIIRIEGSSGIADKLYMCMKSSTDTYSWVQIATG